MIRINVMTTHLRRILNQRRHRATPDGKAVIRKYDSSCKGKATRRKAQRKYRASPENKTYQRRRVYGEGAPEHFDTQLKAQVNLCAICGCELVEGKATHLDHDHDHDTEQLRGVLCHHCNVGLGNVREVPELLRSAADYLERWERHE
jgi:hypothetical protein